MEDRGNQNNHVLPGNHARGWNDPPQFMYDAQKQAGSITASNPLATNKRVGHDLSSTNAQNTSTVTHTGVAPPSAVLASVPILNMPAKSETAASTPGKAEVEIVAPEIADDGELCQYCIRCFSSSLQSLQDRDKLEMKLANDITKRIKIFQQSWTSGKISAKAKPNCARLCRALELEEYAAAHDIHLQLMTDHVSEVSQWMVGIKKMIQAGNSS